MEFEGRPLKPAATEVEAEFSEACRAPTDLGASAESGGQHEEVGQLSWHLYSAKMVHASRVVLRASRWSSERPQPPHHPSPLRK